MVDKKKNEKSKIEPNIKVRNAYVPSLKKLYDEEIIKKMISIFNYSNV